MKTSIILKPKIKTNLILMTLGMLLLKIIKILKQLFYIIKE